jgi:hypothetical protein
LALRAVGRPIVARLGAEGIILIAERRSGPQQLEPRRRALLRQVPQLDGAGISLTTAVMATTVASMPTAATSPDGRRCFRATTAAMALVAITALMPPVATLATTAASTSTAAMSPDGRRCFRATTAAMAGKLRCVDQIAVTPFALEIGHALTPEISGRKT